LYRFRFANQPGSTHLADGLALRDCYIAAVVRCAPPGNKPLKEEFEACRPYLLEELRALRHLKVVVSLGKIAFDEYLKACQERGCSIGSPKPAFGHGKVYAMGWGITLIGSYHPSQQNTFTGRLTRPMLHNVFELARKELE
jgi:uracil-DNA glycosylase family 4